MKLRVGDMQIRISFIQQTVCITLVFKNTNTVFYNFIPRYQAGRINV
jgi:hypothetical protein